MEEKFTICVFERVASNSQWIPFNALFVDVNLFKVSEEKAFQMSEDKSLLINHVGSIFGARMFEHDDLADEAENLMIKLKFLTYKLGTMFLLQFLWS